MPNYQNGVIYKISCNNPDITDFYIGSTDNFNRRKGEHKKNCYNEKIKKYNYKIYQTIRDNGGWENWIMIEIEKFPCNTEEELKEREDYWVVELQSTLNKRRPKRSMKQYREDNRQVLAEKRKDWYEKNKEILAEKRKDWYENNKEQVNAKKREKVECNHCSILISKGNLSKHIRNIHNL